LGNKVLLSKLQAASVTYYNTSI